MAWPLTVTVIARLILDFYVLVDNLLPFLLKAGAAAGVAHGAHIGGFLPGLRIALALGHRAPMHGKG